MSKIIYAPILHFIMVSSNSFALHAKFHFYSIAISLPLSSAPMEPQAFKMQTKVNGLAARSSFGIFSKQVSASSPSPC